MKRAPQSSKLTLLWVGPYIVVLSDCVYVIADKKNLCSPSWPVEALSKWNLPKLGTEITGRYCFKLMRPQGMWCEMSKSILWSIGKWAIGINHINSFQDGIHAEEVKKTRFYQCRLYPYFNDIRAVKGHYVGRHLEVSEAPAYCLLCQAKYVDEASIHKHLQNEGHRACTILFPEQAVTCVGQTNWQLIVEGPDRLATAWDVRPSNRFWALQKSIKGKQLDRPCSSTVTSSSSLSTSNSQPRPAQMDDCPLRKEVPDRVFGLFLRFLVILCPPFHPPHQFPS